MPNFDPFKNPIGLDISDVKIRYLQLKKRKKYSIINSFGEISVPTGLIKNGVIYNENQVANLIRKMFLNPVYGKIESKYVNASLPEDKTFIKTIQIPKVPEEEVKGTVRWGIEQNIPLSTDQINFDWQVLEEKTNDKSKKMNVLAAICPISLVESYTKVIKKTDYIPISLENESINTTRCLTDLNSVLKNPILILDIGYSRTILIIYEYNTIPFTSTLKVSGSQMTTLISQTLKLKETEAEKAKIICGLDKRKGKGAVRRILEPQIKNLIKKINETLEYYNTYLGSNKKINSILLTGGGSQMIGLNKYLQENLKINIIAGDPLTNIMIEKKKTDEILSKTSFTPYTTAIGLALKKID